MVMKLKNQPDTGRGFGMSVGRLLSFDLCNDRVWSRISTASQPGIEFSHSK